MTQQEIDRIESAIRHIQTAADVDPWAAEIAVEAMRKQIPKKTIKPGSPFYRYACPTCENYPLHGQYCNECGQRIVYDKEWMKDDK